jgi:hypothetical protein
MTWQRATFDYKLHGAQISAVMYVDCWQQSIAVYTTCPAHADNLQQAYIRQGHIDQ